MSGVQSSSVPPGAQEYGGDEISALVLDPGYSSVRAGFAGEDVPKSVVPSHYGTIGPLDSPEVKYIFGDNSIHTPLPNLHIHNPMSKDGTVEDWDTATKLWEYAITSRLTNFKASNPAMNGLNDPPENGGNVEADIEASGEGEKPLEDNPLLMTETGWNSGKSRERSIEVAMENWGCPAFWLARNGVCVAFAGGKASALVVDVGVMRSPLAGNFISQQLRILFSTSNPQIPLIPHYLVASKTPVDAGAPAVATYRQFDTSIHDSFRRLEEERVLQEFKESVVQVWQGPGRLNSGQQGTTNEEVVKSWPGRPFEMPDGWNQVFGGERFRVSEGMWDAKMALTDPENPAPPQSQTIPALIQASLAAVDVDIRPHLLANVVITGGTSLLYGFTDRLNSELTQMFPGPRVRLSAPGNTAERRFASWIGGSILGSLGAFHQMWVSKKEYEEHGAGIVEKRCK
ncbi:NuA4 histone acetyltransferase subunit [Glutinoglossum americanum]|uniref:NuA4 histone acetyltransferase subunit n=1 Tax=Glutinoglossum americanum TaxID=1670608 RepID=A0A9P8L5D5_9PEZI|nr:NuA4 histone acetyltransferase subunit [Glutinoglossum americanum]